MVAKRQTKKTTPKKKKKAKKQSTKKQAAKKQKGKKAEQAVPVGVLGTAKLYSVVRERISCGCTPLDAIMGGPTTVTEDGEVIPSPSDGTLATNWGVPVGRIIEVVGAYSTGKSTFCENLAAQVQRVGGEVCMGITEYTLDPARMARIGVDTHAVKYLEFEFIEDGYAWIKSLLGGKKHNKPMLITWDTIGASHSKDDRPGSGGRVVREGLREITGLVAKHNALMVFVNHVSATFNQWDTEPATPFGQGIRFHASIRMEFRSAKKFLEAQAVQAGGQVYSESKASYGVMPYAVARKNKTFPPHRRTRIPVTFQGGFDDDFAMFEYLSQRASHISVTAPGKEDTQNLGKVITFHMPTPAACYWNTYRQFLIERTDVRAWMVDQCRRLAYNGFDPVG